MTKVPEMRWDDAIRKVLAEAATSLHTQKWQIELSGLSSSARLEQHPLQQLPLALVGLFRPQTQIFKRRGVDFSL